MSQVRTLVLGSRRLFEDEEAEDHSLNYEFAPFLHHRCTLPGVARTKHLGSVMEIASGDLPAIDDNWEAIKQTSELAHEVKALKMSDRVFYRIRVQGGLDPAWSDRLEGLAIVPEVSSDGTKITTLSGYLSDQTALSGVLSTIYELHLPILHVQYLGQYLLETAEKGQT